MRSSVVDPTGIVEPRVKDDDAQISRLPSGDHIIPAIEALRLHRALVAADCTCTVIAPGCKIVPRRDDRITRA